VVAHVIEKEGSHSLLSPSSASRWMYCPGAPHLEAMLEDTSSVEADEGTAAHYVAECTLKKFASAPVLGDTVTVPTGRTFEVTEEMLDAVQIFIDSVNSAEVELGATAKIESRVHIVKGVCEGTLDAMVISEDGLKVNDFKYGKGVEVDADWNEQLMIYAHGALKDAVEKGFEVPDADFEIEILITQPRHFKDANIKSWFTTYGELSVWADFELIPAIDRARVKNTTYVPGDKQCQWCKAVKAGTCLAAREAGQIVARAQGAEFDDAGMSFPTNVAEFSVEQLAASLEMMAGYKVWTKMMKARFEQVNARSLEYLTDGITVPGFKRVLDRKSASKWTDEEKAAALAYSHKIDPMAKGMMSVAKLRDKFIDAGVDTAQLLKLSEYTQKKIVVPDADKRQAVLVEVTPEELFK